MYVCCNCSMDSTCTTDHDSSVLGLEFSYSEQFLMITIAAIDHHHD